MNVTVTRQFEKELDKIPKHILKRTDVVITQLLEADSLLNIAGIKKLKGHSAYYRIRIGDYRLGIFLESDKSVECVTICHRKDVYNTFP